MTGPNHSRALRTINLHMPVCLICLVLVDLNVQPPRHTLAREKPLIHSLQVGEQNVTDSSMGGWADAMSCPIHQDTVWEEWKNCASLTLSTVAGDEPFYEFIARNGAQFPWTAHSNHTAVLLEFRAMPSRMNLIVHNMITNLPVHWRVQVLGGDAVCNLARHLFPHEIAADKIVVTLIDKENVEQV